jgi:glucose/arabinose dehydrogenase
MRPTATRAAAIALLAAAGAAHAQQFGAVRVAAGLTRPVFVTAPPGDYGRLFIVEQRGSAGVAARADIKIMNLPGNTINATPFLSIFNLPTNTQTNSEQGLLGLAFDPDFANNGFFYINYTNATTSAGTTFIERYHVNPATPNVADPASGTVILRLVQPFTNHNGGWLGFGPDGYLYAALGDGGSGGDPGNRAQNTALLFGKIHRIIPSGDAFPADPDRNYTIPATNPFAGSATQAQEIWAYGLRNPWRPSFDRLTGDLWIADVGQDVWEEVNFQPAAVTPPFTARNYGWRCYEGNANYNTSGCGPIGNYTFPIHTYQHTIAGNECSVTGGYVYRGCDIPGLAGTYFFSDYCAARTFSFRYSGGVMTEFTNRTTQLVPVGGPTPAAITSWGEDAWGELYFMGAGNLFKLVPTCAANCDASTQQPILNVLDFNCFLNKFSASDCYANCDNSTAPPTLNVLDFNCFLNQFAAGCP